MTKLIAFGWYCNYIQTLPRSHPPPHPGHHTHTDWPCTTHKTIVGVRADILALEVATEGMIHEVLAISQLTLGFRLFEEFCG